MEVPTALFRLIRMFLLLTCFIPFRVLIGQTVSEALPGFSARQLPVIATLMQAVEEHQKAYEAIIKNYLYTSTVTETELNGRGDTTKTKTTESEIFYVDGVRLQQVMRRDGKDLGADEQRKEKERIDKDIEKAKERRAKQGTGASKNTYTVTFARFLELGSFSNERRVVLRGRNSIALDYTGDPKAKTRNPLEAGIHDMAGTVWVDEEDKALSRIEGHFVNSFKVGGGLIASVAKDTSFAVDSTRVNGEVWLPSRFSAQGSARTLLFFSFNGSIEGTSTNYRRFKTNSIILPDLHEVQTPDSTGNPPLPEDPPEAKPRLP